MCSNPRESEVTCFRPESNRGSYGLLNFLCAALSTTELWWRINHRKSFRTLTISMEETGIAELKTWSEQWLLSDFKKYYVPYGDSVTWTQEFMTHGTKHKLIMQQLFGRNCSNATASCPFCCSCFISFILNTLWRTQFRSILCLILCAPARKLCTFWLGHKNSWRMVQSISISCNNCLAVIVVMLQPPVHSVVPVS